MLSYKDEKSKSDTRRSKKTQRSKLVKRAINTQVYTPYNNNLDTDVLVSLGYLANG